MITKLTRGRGAMGRLYARFNGQSVYLGAPIAADDDRIVVTADFVLNGAQTIAAQPDVPRNLTITMVDANASITGGTITIVGEDPLGRAISDAWVIPSNLGTKTTTNIYAKVTSVTTSGITGAIGAGVDQVKVGVGDVIGLPFDIVATSAVRHVFLGAVRIASPTVAVGVGTSGVNVAASTYNGTKVLQAFVAE